MTTVINKQVLVLNADYQPIRVVGWKRAIKLWVKDKVEIVEEYHDEDIRSINFTMKCPAVVRLLNYVKQVNRRKIRFSRMNVYSRDKYTCVYCNDKPGAKLLTLDHVVPKSLGGKTTWDNIVTACWPCNSKKADKTLEQVGFNLVKKPKEPSVSDYMTFSIVAPKTPEAWRNYIYWNAEIG